MSERVRAGSYLLEHKETGIRIVANIYEYRHELEYPDRPDIDVVRGARYAETDAGQKVMPTIDLDTGRMISATILNSRGEEIQMIVVG